jgi:hypothetical protein
MSRKSGKAVALVGLLVVIPMLRGGVGHAQPSNAPISGHFTLGATSVISPVVVAEWFASRQASTEQLELLVLWRGSPGWFLQPGGSGGSGSGANGPHYTWIKYGNVTLSLDFDPAKRTVTVQGKNLVLADNNVLFVDDVDGPTGPHLTGTMTIARPMPGSSGQIGLVLQKSPRIMSFLDCDAGSQSPHMALLEPLCLQNVGLVR